jgi:hypothetical protein
VPCISSFYGIAVYLYFEDHPPPHIHVRYSGHKASVAIATAELVEGNLPRRAHRLVAEWIETHREELYVCWDRATRAEPPGTIDPLP